MAQAERFAVALIGFEHFLINSHVASFEFSRVEARRPAKPVQNKKSAELSSSAGVKVPSSLA